MIIHCRISSKKQKSQGSGLDSQEHRCRMHAPSKVYHDTIFHWKLRYELAAYGARIECLNFNFEDTPEGEFVETIVAAQDS